MMIMDKFDSKCLTFCISGYVYIILDLLKTCLYTNARITMRKNKCMFLLLRISTAVWQLYFLDQLGERMLEGGSTSFLCWMVKKYKNFSIVPWQSSSYKVMGSFFFFFVSWGSMSKINLLDYFFLDKPNLLEPWVLCF